MEGRYPNGLMFAMTSCKDPAREQEFNDWYNHIHLPDVTAPGIYSHATRFANTGTNVKPGEGGYIALYETNWEDLPKAAAIERQALDIVRAEGRVTPLIDNVLVSTFKRLGGEFHSSSRLARGILAVLSNCTDAIREDEFNNWYNDIHIPDILDTRLYHTAYRFESQDPQATRGKYLALYETDHGDPGKARHELGKHSPRWKESGRMHDALEVVFAISARRIWPTD